MKLHVDILTTGCDTRNTNSHQVNVGQRSMKTALINRASQDKPHRAMCSASHVALLSSVCYSKHHCDTRTGLSVVGRRRFVSINNSIQAQPKFNHQRVSAYSCTQKRSYQIFTAFHARTLGYGGALDFTTSNRFFKIRCDGLMNNYGIPAGKLLRGAVACKQITFLEFRVIVVLPRVSSKCFLVFYELLK